MRATRAGRPRAARWIGLATALAALGLVALWMGPDREQQAPPMQPAAWPIPDLEGRETSPEVSLAVAEARRAVRRSPGSPGAWGALGEVFDAHGLRAQAVVAYGRAASLDPAAFRWATLLGVARASLGQPAEDFVPEFERALSLRPDDVAARHHYGQALLAAGRREDGVGVLGELVRRRPDLAAARESYGLALLAAGRPGEAIVQLETVLSTDPESARALSFLAQAYGREGRAEEARVASARARSATKRTVLPDALRFEVNQRRVDAATLGERARSLSAARRFPEAVVAWERFLGVAGPDPEPLALVELGNALCATGRFAEAIEPYTRAVSARDDLLPVHHQLAVLLNARGLHASAQAHARRVLEDQPEHWQARTQLAIAGLGAGDLESALREFELASRAEGRLDPSAEQAWGKALLQLGRPDEAAPHLALAQAK